MLFLGGGGVKLWRLNMNIYADVTDRILKKLDEGIVPWRKNLGDRAPPEPRQSERIPRH